MALEAMKKLYICCQKNQKPLFMARANAVYGENWQIVDRLEEADRVLLVGNNRTEQIQREIIQAEELGISLQQVNENFAVEEFKDALLSNKKQVNILGRTEKAKTHERER